MVTLLLDDSGEPARRGDADETVAVPPSGRQPGRYFGRTEAALFALYAAVVAFMTWPAVTLFNRTYGQRGDPLGIIWDFWWVKYAHARHLPVNMISIVAVPFGMKQNLGSVDPLAVWSLRAASIATTETVAYNLFILVSYLAAAIAMYYLARRITGSRPAGAFAGFVFAFSPYMLMQGKEHIALLTVFWMPVFFYFLLRAWKERTALMYVLSVVSFVLMGLTSYHYGLIGGILAAVFVLSVWLMGKPWRRLRQRSFVRSVLPGLLVVLAVAALVAVALLRKQWQAKDIANLYYYSGRPWDYFIPHAEAYVLGGVTGSFVKSNLHGSFLSENSLFLGFVPMALGVYCLYCSWRGGRREAGALAEEAVQEEGVPKEGGSGETVTAGPLMMEDRRLAAGLAISAAACFLVSMPPSFELFGLKIYLPSYLLHKFVPQVRAYARFGMGVMFCVALLAAGGLAMLLEKKWFSAQKAAVTAVLCVVVLLEFSIVPPFRSLETGNVTDYDRWLRANVGESAVAFYPFYYADDFRNYGYFFEQRHHSRKILNGYVPGTEAEKLRQGILGITDPETPRILKTLQCDYVVVFPDLYLEGGHMNYTDRIAIDTDAFPPALEKVKEFPDCVIYENKAEPADFVPVYVGGTYQAIVEPDDSVFHPGTGDMTVDIRSELDSDVACDISFLAAATSSTGRLKVTLNGASSSVTLTTVPTELVLSNVVLKPGSNYLRLETDAPAAPVVEVPGVTTVDASMAITDPRVTITP